MLCTRARPLFIENVVWFKAFIGRRRILGLLAVSLLFFGACGADPTPEDVTRIKEQFLVLRFRAPLVAELRHLSDRELFQRSCKNHRVRCEFVLEMIQKDDPEFYSALGTAAPE